MKRKVRTRLNCNQGLFIRTHKLLKLKAELSKQIYCTTNPAEEVGKERRTAFANVVAFSQKNFEKEVLE